MSIFKNPIILALFVAALVFVIMYYWCNSTGKSEKPSKGKKSKKDEKQKKKEGISETVVISAAIAGLATWYIASSYLGEKSGDEEVSTAVEKEDTITSTNNPQQLGGKNPSNKVPHISSDDPTRSYNLIGSGLNIPRAELKIPNVLIDYK